MKIYLINPDYMLYANAPLGLAYLASYIRQKFPKISVKILDQMPEKQMLALLKEEQPEIIGLTSVSENWFMVKRLGEEIKKVSGKSRLIIGGVHVTTFPKCFEKSVFDYGILGEGEISLSNIIELIKDKKEDKKSLRKLKGLIFREDKKVINTGIAEQIKDLNEIPPPAFDLLNMKYYSLPNISSGFQKSFVILTSRGCPYKCTFCSSSCFWERKIRFFSAERVTDEIEMLYKKYGFDTIEIGDDLFSINEERLKSILTGLKNKGLIGKIRFRCTARANNFNESIAKLLKEMGVYLIAFGFESGSDKELKWLKGESVSVELNKKAVEICKKYGMIAFGFFMIGSPYETIEDMKKTQKFIKENCRNNFAIYQTIAYPGTDVWDYAVKNKIIEENIFERETKEFLASDIQHLLTREVSKEEFKKIYEDIRSLQLKRKRRDIIKSIRLKNIPSLFNVTFIKKIWNLRGRFLNRIK